MNAYEKSAPGSWRVCQWKRTYTVWRWNGNSLDRIANASGNRKRFRSQAAALAAADKANGAQP